MGNRANIQIKYSEGNDIFFYSHWSGRDVDNIVQSALLRGKSRWDDESYLARIIFVDLIRDDVFDLIGNGISPYEIEAGSPKCIVDMPSQKVIDTYGKQWTFEEFAYRPIKKI